MEHSVQRLGQFDNDPTSICFGAGVETSMMKVEGRYLPPPVLEYGLLETDRNYRPGADDNAQHVYVNDGSWNLRNIALRCICPRRHVQPPTTLGLGMTLAYCFCPPLCAAGSRPAWPPGRWCIWAGRTRSTSRTMPTSRRACCVPAA